MVLVGAQAKALGVPWLSGATVGNPTAPAIGARTRPQKTTSPLSAHDEVASATRLTGETGQGAAPAIPTWLGTPANAASNVVPVATSAPFSPRLPGIPESTSPCPLEGAGAAPLLQAGVILQRPAQAVGEAAQKGALEGQTQTTPSLPAAFRFLVAARHASAATDHQLQMSDAATIPGAALVQPAVATDVAATIADTPVVQAGTGAGPIDVRPTASGADVASELPSSPSRTDAATSSAPVLTCLPLGGRAAVPALLLIRTSVALMRATGTPPIAIAAACYE